MNMKHVAAPNSEGCDMVTPESQASSATVPEQLAKLKSAAANNNDSEATKIVSRG